ncbi:MAG: hypothetical protein L0154_29635 [Chloroflexi bacterium]|nr:hypothetical protein [Chloroflexota bacterium]
MSDLGPIEPRDLRDNRPRNQQGQRNDPASPPPGAGLGNFDAPDLRRRVSVDDELRQEARVQSPGGFALLSERQVEALGWGITVILLGIAVLLTFTSGSRDFLLTVFPILGGALLLMTSIYQIMRGWPVSLVTWLTSIGLTAFAITRLIALVDAGETDFGTSIAYFIGVSIIVTGITVLFRIFRSR